MGKCPCCGQKVPDISVEMLRYVDLSPQQDRLLKAFYIKYPQSIPVWALIEHLYAESSRRPKDARGVVKVQIGRINEALWPYGWEIQSIHRALKNGDALTGRYALRERQRR